MADAQVSISRIDAEDPLAAQKERLWRAAWDLEDAIQRAHEAIGGIAPEGVKTVLPDALAAAIQRMHADEHGGPARWCTHPVCREADTAATA